MKENIRSITFKILEENDIPKILDMLEKDSVNKYLFFRDLPREAKEQYFMSLLGKDSVYIILVDGEFAGNCGIAPTEDGDYNIGYQLDDKFWGMGIGKATGEFIYNKAIEKGAKVIVADCIEENIGSRKIIESLGLEFFEKVENKYFLNGVWHNNLYFKKVIE